MFYFAEKVQVPDKNKPLGTKSKTNFDVTFLKWNFFSASVNCNASFLVSSNTQNFFDFIETHELVW